ncbi:DUF1254 domain-containing protein [Asticcacaulis solisilvae]|uniref:DUF1254 domain-containing protein n=1 Tax=Asticcacaulis solisilvae TaxID=1217274 RepID=UPI003FD6F712
MTHAVLSRRALLGGATLLGAAALLPLSTFAADDAASPYEQAVLWGYPLVETGRYLKLSQDKGFGFNQFYLNARLATPSLKVAGPNIDTIYGFAWLDLSREPVVLDVPDTADRYYSIQLIDAYENVFAYVGRRETGTKAGTYVIAPPGWTGQAPAGARVIQSPTALVFALTRTLVRGEKDAAVAAELQKHYRLAPLSGWPSAAKDGIVKDDVLNILPVLDLGSGGGAGFFDELNALVKAYPPAGQETVNFARLAPLGLGTDAFAAGKPSDAVLDGALKSAQAKIKAANVAEVENGWRVNRHITRFIQDPAERAANNAYGPGAHIAEEALYFSAVGDAGNQPLSGANTYTLTFAKGQLPPVDAFWSLILYGPDFFLVDNPLDRYGINDRTPGLKRNADGSLTLVISHVAPKDKANWLPAPEGRFQLLFRTYQPGPALLDGSYKLPPLQRA